MDLRLQGAPVEVGKEFSEGYMRTVSLAYKDKLDHLTEEILTYDGESTQPCWLDKGSSEYTATPHLTTYLSCMLIRKPGRGFQADLFRPRRPV